MIQPAPKSATARTFAILTPIVWFAAFVLFPSPWLPQPLGYVLSFLASMLGMLCFFTSMGLYVEDSVLGILLSSRNTYSLARLQMVLWTILALSALAAAAACRMWNGTDALAIKIPTELLEAMGISFASAAVAPAVLSLKSQTAPTTGQVAAATERVGGPVEPSGQLFGRPQDAPAYLGDLVKGDDLASAGTIDLSKVQQLFITALLVIVYGRLLVKLFHDDGFQGLSTDLPPFDPSFVTLMLVSHGGYLAYKASPKPPPDGTPAVRPPAPDRNVGLAGGAE